MTKRRGILSRDSKRWLLAALTSAIATAEPYLHGARDLMGTAQRSEGGKLSVAKALGLVKRFHNDPERYVSKRRQSA